MQSCGSSFFVRKEVHMSGSDVFQGFSVGAYESAKGSDQIIMVPLRDVRPFDIQTFQARDDEDMERLMESVREHGILEPILAFSDENGEIVCFAGQRRCLVAEKLGYEMVPVRVLNVNRDEATVLMGESNFIQRKKVLPSESAFTYKVMYEAMRRLAAQDQPETEKNGERIREQLAARVGESGSQIRRYIRLTELIPPLLEHVDQGRLCLRSAVEISYLPEDLQQEVERFLRNQRAKIPFKEASVIHQLQSQGTLTKKDMRTILSGEKDDSELMEKIAFRSPILIRMLAPYKTIADKEDRIIRGLLLLNEQERGGLEMNQEQELDQDNNKKEVEENEHSAVVWKADEGSVLQTE